MTDAPSTRAWSSGLSTNEFAACVSAGFQPLGFVQGCSVMSWSFLGMNYSPMGFGATGRPSGYFEQYNCPHGFVSAEHRMYGLNYQKTWIEQTWTSAFEAARSRLIAEATALGAHGVVGVVDRQHYFAENATFEFSLSGTAVGIEGSPVPHVPFTTFLAGQKLNKLVEAGFAPVAIALGISAVGVFSSCVTEYQLSGGLGAGYGWATASSRGGEIDQLSRAQTAARSLVREHVRAQLGNDVLHGASLSISAHEASEGPQFEVTLRGNRVRPFKDFATLEPPRPVVRLVDR